MWHHKTKLCTLWIIEQQEDTQKYFLGCDDMTLGVYDSLDKVLHDVSNQETGYLKWDEHPKAQAPVDISQWVNGEPAHWDEVVH